jgi:carbon storage regulator
MLVLSRRKGERIRIGADIEIVVNYIRGQCVSLAIDAPRQIPVVRGELPLREDPQPEEEPCTN